MEKESTAASDPPAMTDTVELVSLEQARHVKSAVKGLAIVHTADAVYLANEGDSEIDVPKRTHLGGPSAGTFVPKPTTVGTSVPFAFPQEDKTLVEQEHIDSPTKFTVTTLYSCLRSWQDDNGVSELEPVRSRDAYKVELSEPKMYLPDAGKEGAFDDVPYHMRRCWKASWWSGLSAFGL